MKMSLERFTSDGIIFSSDTASVQEIKAIYWPKIRAKGYFIVVKPYIRPEKSDGLMIPDSLRFEDAHHSVAAQVLDIGPVAYTDEKICGGVSWAEIGDWVFIPRVAGSRVAFKDEKGADVVLRIVKEDDIIAVIKDPAEWEIRITQTKY
jgi:co-chaperonin GroES (HSP10)